MELGGERDKSSGHEHERVEGMCQWVLEVEEDKSMGKALGQGKLGVEGSNFDSVEFQQ